MLHASLWMSSVHELLKAYGLWALFVGITLEGMGIPLPGETMLISAALYAGSTHRLAIGSVMLVATTAATIGGMIGYVIGRWIGHRGPFPLILQCRHVGRRARPADSATGSSRRSPVYLIGWPHARARA